MNIKEKINKLEEELKDLKLQKEWEKFSGELKTLNGDLAQIEYGMKVPKDIADAYDKLFHETINQKLKEIKYKAEEIYKKKKFVIRIGFE